MSKPKRTEVTYTEGDVQSVEVDDLVLTLGGPPVGLTADQLARVRAIPGLRFSDGKPAEETPSDHPGDGDSDNDKKEA